MHLHVMNGPGPLNVGWFLPYVFDSFTITAVDEAGTEDFDKAEATGVPITLTPRVPPQRLEKRTAARSLGGRLVAMTV